MNVSPPAADRVVVALRCGARCGRRGCGAFGNEPAAVAGAFAAALAPGVRRCLLLPRK
eukprot:COSAG01_NODE_19_length_39011_cov_38.134968_19_plen_58_part_00